MGPLLLFWFCLLPVLLPQARSYEASKASGQIVVDGDLSDRAWDQAPWTDDFMDIRGPEWSAPAHRTRVKILWDDQYLYVAAEMVEPHLWATLTERDAIIYRDDDFEVFLDPEGDGRDYFEVEINAYGTVLDLFMDRPYRERGSALIPWDIPGLQAGVGIDGSLNDPSDQDQGWTVELALPWDGLVPPAKELDPSAIVGDPDGAAHEGWARGPPDPDAVWRVNFSRVDWPLEIVREETTGRLVYGPPVRPGPGNRHPEENWVWSPQGEINMHIPDRWGWVRFVDPNRREGRR